MPIFASSTSAGSPGKGERADEQAHREADPAEHRDAVDLEPGRAASGAARPRRTDSQTAPKMPSCLPRNRPAAMPSGSGASSAQPDARERDAGIGEAEQRHDQEGDPGREPVLEPVQRRIRRVRRARRRDERHGGRGEHAGDGRVDPRQQHRVPEQRRRRAGRARAGARRSCPSRTWRAGSRRPRRAPACRARRYRRRR